MAAGPGAGPGAPSEAEAAQLCRSLEVGTVMTLFYSKKSQRPERKTFQVKLETRQVTWSRGSDKVEGAVDIREIKEIRPGRNSRDFDRYQEDPCFRPEHSHCFVVLYGTEFRLKTLSLQATSEDEVNMWIKGLNWLVADTLRAPTPLQIERWLRKQFYSLDRNREDRISAKDLKNMLSQVNYRVPNMRFLRERLTDVEQRNGDITYGQFAQLYRSLMFSAQKTMDVPFLDRGAERPEHFRVSLLELQKFLLEYQRELWAADTLQVQEFMFNFLRDPLREIDEPYFSLDEFLTFLFSKENSIWNSQLDMVCLENMNNPLSHYWISSSHNTYLTGDQFSSESSLEAYARCLRMGCRCIELDCWDGPDGMPVIYHGHTLTTKIKFSDVLVTIKEHAFVTSDFPVILSIEDHCSIAQQRNMAQNFKKVFGDMLLTKPVDISADGLPSPNQLKRKILIKHKKLAEGSAYEELPTSVMYSENDISNSIKNGILYLEDPINHEWNPHYFVLTSSKIYYSGETTSDQGNEDEEEQKEGSNSTELHSVEKWFHGKLGAGRDGRHIAERLLTEYCIETGAPDGSFLVRESETFVGDYTLSFWRNGKVQHCRIHSRQDAGSPKFFLTDNLVFDSLYELITHYQEVPLRCNEFEMRLTEPVPQTNAHESKEWYHANLTRAQAEHMLMRVPRDGAFLVRKRSEPSSYAISFRAEGKIKHCRVQQEVQTVLLGNTEFDSLVDLISYYEKHPLYRKMKLRYPINEETLEKIGTARACYRDMSSFPETKAEKYVNKIKGKKFLQYNRLQLSRIYPKGQRLDSSNYDPLPMWICGSQLVALNFQTPDKPMQMNQALFMSSGQCGYVLQPTNMRDDIFDPFDKSTLRGTEPLSISIEVLGARHLPKNGRGIVCPFVEVEVSGAEYDNAKQKTEIVADNGLNPLWTPKQFHFQVSNPDFAFLRFVVYEEDMFSDENFLAQATFLVKGLKTGFRAVPLKNNYSENLELASLLVKIDIFPCKQENGEINLFNASSLRERAGDGSSQLLASRGREGSFELRYQQPFEDFRVAPEQLNDHFESRERRVLRRTRVNGDNRL
ncbi:1-phosphatidylinositol 4,5-bisphosphate phosphodiesterase gamma-1 isoform X3 [Zonotrichia albicollis]|uniref:1-phosphatidylinositol 4,5-bisphosphate phosphodiesterase gamma-1 isoform X3 n=1 Tax=Zonotrichia albicollis TaxID=44394 RepID=UPI003D80F04B